MPTPPVLLEIRFQYRVKATLNDKQLAHHIYYNRPSLMLSLCAFHTQKRRSISVSTKNNSD
jgi:hypothetical protein